MAAQLGTKYQRMIREVLKRYVQNVLQVRIVNSKLTI